MIEEDAMIEEDDRRMGDGDEKESNELFVVGVGDIII